MEVKTKRIPTKAFKDIDTGTVFRDDDELFMKVFMDDDYMVCPHCDEDIYAGKELGELPFILRQEMFTSSTIGDVMKSSMVLLQKNKRVERLSFFVVWFRRMTSKSHFFQIFSFVKFFSVSHFSTGSHFQMTNCGDVKFSNELRFSWSCDSTSCAGRQILKQLELQTFVKFYL